MILPHELRGLRVLIADDNPASREILQSIFATWSIAVEQVASGAEVLGAVETAEMEDRPYDLLLLDWKMPGMSGIETMEAMRANDKLKRLPATLLVTAYGPEDFKSEAAGVDFASFLIKPVDPQVLLETISGLFAGGQGSAAQHGANLLPMVSPSLRGQLVLLAEDNEINREIAVELLMDAGLEVETAENGRIARDQIMARGARFSGVLMDVQMPDMDGIEATVSVRERWPADELPIIAMTAHAYEEERQRCFAAGMNDHISKPVDPAAMVETLNRWLKVRDNSDPAAVSVGAQASAFACLPASLPPFDLEAALRRVNGKAPLLRKLILHFATTYAHFMSLLQGQIKAGDLHAARTSAHTLKGVAASLELRDLAQAAAQVEDMLATGDVDAVGEPVARLAQLLTSAVAAARSLEATGDANEPSNEVPLVEGAGAAAREALELSLRRRSLRARTDFEEYSKAVGLSERAAQSNPVRLAIDRLDYDAALDALDGENVR
jgi:two-component system sensor histidine kinase/response regulator